MLRMFAPTNPFTGLWSLIMVLLFMCATLTMSGCDTVQGPYADAPVEINTFERGLLVAAADTRAFNRALQGRILARDISKADAQKVLDSIRTVNLHLDGATNALVVLDDPVLANSSYANALASLAALKLLLAEGTNNE